MRDSLSFLVPSLFSLSSLSLGGMTTGQHDVLCEVLGRTTSETLQAELRLQYVFLSYISVTEQGGESGEGRVAGSGGGRG